VDLIQLVYIQLSKILDDRVFKPHLEDTLMLVSFSKSLNEWKILNSSSMAFRVTTQPGGESVPVAAEHG